MGKWEFQARNGMVVVVDSDDDALDDASAHHDLELALATADDATVARAMIMTRFQESHEVDDAESDRSSDQTPEIATVRMRRRPERIWK